MVKIDKLSERIESRPIRTDITFKELNNYLVAKGFKSSKCNGGSHRKFSHEALKRPLIFSPHGSNDIVQPYQVKQALEAVDFLEGEEG